MRRYQREVCVTTRWSAGFHVRVSRAKFIRDSRYLYITVVRIYRKTKCSRSATPQSDAPTTMILRSTIAGGIIASRGDVMNRENISLSVVSLSVVSIFPEVPGNLYPACLRGLTATMLPRQDAKGRFRVCKWHSASKDVKLDVFITDEKRLSRIATLLSRSSPRRSHPRDEVDRRLPLIRSNARSRGRRSDHKRGKLALGRNATGDRNHLDEYFA